MSEIDNIIQKINLDYETSKEELKNQFEKKKVELKNGFVKKLEGQKKLLDEKYKQQLELEKKRIFTDEFIKFNKTVESKKQEVLKTIFSLATKKIFEIPKSEYRNFIKNLILKNLFLGQKNEILFDTTNKLSDKEKQELINEIISEVKNLKSGTEIIISQNNSQNISFGIIIFSNKQSKDLSLESVLNMFKTDLEIESAKILFD
jgi:vacuolar-type H+-ATPase subunit E/Vma4